MRRDARRTHARAHTRARGALLGLFLEMLINDIRLLLIINLGHAPAAHALPRLAAI